MDAPDADQERYELQDLSDLPPLWTAMAVAGFLAVMGLVFGVPSLLGYDWVWKLSPVLGPLVAGAYFFGTQDWWVSRSGLLDRAPCTLRSPISDRADLRLLHRRARLALWRWGTTALLAPVVAVGTAVIGSSAAEDIKDVIEVQPHLSARVVSVENANAESPDVLVDIPGTGRRLVDYSEYISPRPEVGDVVEVVENPYTGEVIPVAYRTSWYNTTWSAAAIAAGVAGLLAFAGFGMGATKRRAALAVLGARDVQDLTVVSHDGDEAFVVADSRGQRLRWTLSNETRGRRPPVGGRVVAAGDLSPGGWAAARGPHHVLWTHQRLAAA